VDYGSQNVDSSGANSINRHVSEYNLDIARVHDCTCRCDFSKHAADALFHAALHPDKDFFAFFAQRMRKKALGVTAALG
jgi:hypothetical protein